LIDAFMFTYKSENSNDRIQMKTKTKKKDCKMRGTSVISHLLREDALLGRLVHKWSWTRRYVLPAAKLVGQAFERNMKMMKFKNSRI